MKNLILIIMSLFTFTTTNAQESIYDIEINDIIDFSTSYNQNTKRVDKEVVI